MFLHQVFSLDLSWRDPQSFLQCFLAEGVSQWSFQVSHSMTELNLLEKVPSRSIRSRLQLCPLQEQRRDTKIILVHLSTLLSFHHPQLPQYEDKCAPGSPRWAGWCPQAQPSQLTALAGPLEICCQPWAHSKGKWVGRMGVKLAEQPRGSSPRFCQSALLQTFVASQQEHFKMLELTPQATTAEHSAHLFIYLLLFINWKWICFYTFQVGSAGVCVCYRKLVLAPCSGRSYFSIRRRKEWLTRGTAQQRHQLLQAVSITSSLTFFKTRESLLVLKKVRSK